MQLGIGLFTGQRRPTDDRSMESIYDDMLALVRRTEAVGLDSVWVSEHHYATDSYLPSIFPMLSAFATATEDIKVGSSMALAPFYDPVRLAEDAATVDLLSSGRLTLGVANGYRDVEFDHFGIDKRERALRTEEAMKIVRAAWSEGALDYEPVFSDVSPDATVTPKPERQPQIVLGGVAKAAIRRAALLADGWVAPEKLSITEIHKRIRYIERVREAEKRDGEFTPYVQQYCFVAESTEVAWNQLKNSLFYVQRVYDGWITGNQSDPLSADRRDELEEQAIFGTPEEVTAELERYRDVLGDDVHFILRTWLPGIPADRVRASIEHIGNDVAPQLQ